jgi:hypothetical protein
MFDFVLTQSLAKSAIGFDFGDVLQNWWHKW